MPIYFLRGAADRVLRPDFLRGMASFAASVINVQDGIGVAA